MVFKTRRYGAEAAPGVNYLEYIQSSGTQYIDTGFRPNQDTRVVCEFQLTSSTLEQTPFLARLDSRKASFGIFYPSGGWTADYGSQRLVVSTSISATAKILVDFNKENVSINNESNSFSSETFSASVNLILLARNTNGSLNNYASARLYSCQIYDDGTLIRDYYPAKDPNGEVCMYEKVNKTYAYNAGAGTFTAGPEV